MICKFARLLLVLMAVCLVDVLAQAASAQPISPNNPFKSYNIGGINYGSQQWEKQRRGKSATSTPRRPARVFIRRR